MEQARRKRLDRLGIKIARRTVRRAERLYNQSNYIWRTFEEWLLECSEQGGICSLAGFPRMTSGFSDGELLDATDRGFEKILPLYKAGHVKGRAELSSYTRAPIFYRTSWTVHRSA